MKLLLQIQILHSRNTTYDKKEKYTILQNMRNKWTIAFWLIIGIAIFTRFYALGEVPIVLNHDEAAIGYNGWSIAKTGKDEYGNSFPLLFRSFEDFKLPGYPYATALTTSAFGLTEFAVRLPSALFGVGTVVAVFFLVQQLLVSEKKEKHTVETRLPPYFAMVMLALSPWHINFSRGAFETNSSVFFITLGTLFLLLARKKGLFFVAAGLSFVGALLFYYTARVLIPFICLSYAILYYKQIWTQKKYVGFALVCAFVAILPFLSSFTSVGTARVNQVSIFSEPTIIEPYLNMRIDLNNSLFARIVFNNRLAYFMTFLDNYLKNLNLDFFGVIGTGPYGLIYPWELPFVFIGIASFFIQKSKAKWIMLTWFLATPIVGGLTMNQPNQLRTLPNVVAISIFSGFGMYTVWTYIKSSQLKKLFSLGLLFVGVIFFIQFASIYMLYQPKRDAEHWGDGKKQLSHYVEEKKTQYDTIYVTGDKWRPYIHYLFYTNYDPARFQSSGTYKQIDNIKFGTADWDREDYWRLSGENLADLLDGNTLFILTPSDFAKQQQLETYGKVPYKFTVIDEINGQYLKPAFYAVKLR